MAAAANGAEFHKGTSPLAGREDQPVLDRQRIIDPVPVGGDHGGPKPERVHFRGPSFVNLSALPVMAEGEMIADVVAIIGSLDIVLGEIDR